MNINKDGKTLFFSDDEIDNNTNGEKKVYVTKRINGKESHSKIEKDQNIKFDFNDEIVIGVTPKVNVVDSSKKEKNEKNNKINKSKGKRKNNYNKKTKKKKSSKRIVKIFSGLLLIGAIIVFTLTAPIFNITQIDISGNYQISNDTIVTLSGLKKGQNIFKFNNSIIKNIKENQYIEEVKIKRKLPGTVLITITERKIKYQIKLINSYAYIDKNGYILEISSVKREVPVIVGFNVTENDLINKKHLELEDLEKLNKIQKITKAAESIELDSIITEINVEKEDDFYLYIESKNLKIAIGDTSNLTNKMLFLKGILEKDVEASGTILLNGDISNGFKPYLITD